MSAATDKIRSLLDQIDVLIVMRASTTPGGAAVVRIAEIEP